MSYCTPDELKEATGSNYSEETLQALINDADREINATLQAARVYGGGDALKAASLNLSISKLLTRMRMDGTKISTTSLDGTMNLADDPDRSIAAYEKKAWALIDKYIAYAAPRKRFYVARSDR